MPIVTFSQKDILRSKVVTPGWYRVRIDEATEKASADGNSVNYPCESTIISNDDTGDMEFAGVPVTLRFNSKAIGLAVGFVKAIDPSITITPNMRVDFANAVGKELVVFIANKLYEGNMTNDVKNQYRAVLA